MCVWTFCSQSFALRPLHIDEGLHPLSLHLNHFDFVLSVLLFWFLSHSFQRLFFSLLRWKQHKHISVPIHTLENWKSDLNKRRFCFVFDCSQQKHTQHCGPFPLKRHSHTHQYIPPLSSLTSPSSQTSNPEPSYSYWFEPPHCLGIDLEFFAIKITPQQWLLLTVFSFITFTHLSFPLPTFGSLSIRPLFALSIKPYYVTD